MNLPANFPGVFRAGGMTLQAGDFVPPELESLVPATPSQPVQAPTPKAAPAPAQPSGGSTGGNA